MDISDATFPLVDVTNKFTYVIGNNGVGKSRMLEFNAKYLSASHDVVVISYGLTDRFRFGKTTRREKQGSYTYLGSRTVGNASHLTALSANAVLHYVKSLANGGSVVLLEFLERLGFDPILYIEPRATKRKSFKAAGFSSSVLNHEFVEKFSSIFDDPARPFELVIGKDGGTIAFSGLSSGEQNIISTVLKITSQIKNDVVFILDEPEISLHVEWQLAWPALIHDVIACANNCRLIVATHSPVLISSAILEGGACFNMEKYKALRVITKDEINVEALMLKEFHTYTPKNKALFESFARILGMAIDHVNDRAYSKADIKDQAARLSQHMRKVSATDASRLEVDNAALEFEGAIAEILNRHSKVSLSYDA